MIAAIWLTIILCTMCWCIDKGINYCMDRYL